MRHFWIFATVLFFFNLGAFAEDSSSPFKTMLVQVVASERQLNSLPENLRKTAIVDNKLTYLVANAQSIINGVDPKLIIGLLKDPRRGIEDGNITINPLFLDNVFTLASNNVRPEVMAELQRNEYHTVLIFDERVRDVSLSLKENIHDVIGYFHLEDGEVTFEPNDEYTYFSKNGFMQLNTDIRKQIEEE